MAEYLAIKEVATLFRVSPRTVVRWIRAGYITPIRIGATVRFEKRRLLWQVEKLQSGQQTIREDPSLG